MEKIWPTGQKQEVFKKNQVSIEHVAKETEFLLSMLTEKF